MAKYITGKRANAIARVSSVESMMEDAYSILGEQIERMRLKSRAVTLGEKEAKTLQIYIKSLVDLSKEEREIVKSEEMSEMLSGLSDAELLDMAQKKLQNK